MEVADGHPLYRVNDDSSEKEMAPKVESVIIHYLFDSIPSLAIPSLAIPSLAEAQRWSRHIRGLASHRCMAKNSIP